MVRNSQSNIRMPLISKMKNASIPHTKLKHNKKEK